MGLAEDLKALQELRDRGELSESAYVAARDAAIGKRAQPAVDVKPQRPIATLAKALIVVFVLFVGLSIFARLERNKQFASEHRPQPLTDEIQNLPANSWKSFYYGFPIGGKLDVTIEVKSGNPIDVFLTDQSQEELVKDGEWEKVKTYSSFDATKTKTYQRSGYLKPGSYCLVLRDTSLGVVSAPATDVAVKATLTLPAIVPSR